MSIQRGAMVAAWLLAGAMPLALWAEPPVQTDVWEAIEDHLETCAPAFAQADTEVASQGMGDANYFRVPGHPYVRVDRLMASYADALSSVEAAGEWLEQLRDNDAFAREIELANLGVQDPERRLLLNDLRLCAVWQTAFLMEQPGRARDFIAAVAAAPPMPPVDSPPPPPRFAPTEDCPAGGWSRQWHREPLPGERPAIEAVEAGIPTLRHSPLGRAAMFASWRERLAEHHAPDWLDDGVGMPVARLRWGADGVEADPGRAAVYYHSTLARVGAHTVEQLNYLGFEADAKGRIVDGWVWRTTLDGEGRPQMHEYLSMRGRAHTWYPTPGLRPRLGALPAQVTVAPGPLAIQSPQLCGDGLPRVRPRPQAEGSVSQRYVLLPYDDLFRLPMPRGGERSAFDADGQLRRPGQPTLYQLGRQAVAPDSPWPFDAPGLLSAVFTGVRGAKPAAAETAGLGVANTKGWVAAPSADGPYAH